MTLDSVSKCPNGKRGSLKSWQPAIPSLAPSIHFFDCSDSELTSPLGKLTVARNRLTSRQPSFSCDAPCSTTCSSTPGGQYNSRDCDSLSRWMWQRSGQFPVQPGERIVLSWGTCMYAFTSSMPSLVTWCDAQWAQIGAYIAQPCLTGSGGGGTCTGEGFRVDVLSNDGNTHTPVPYGISAASVTPSPTDSTSSSTLFTYTDVPRPLMTTVSPNDSQYGSSNNVPIFPVIFGVLGGVSFLTFILACVFLVRRRSMHKNIPLPSEDPHEHRPRLVKVSHGSVSRPDLSTLNSQQTTLPRPASYQTGTGSRGPTRQSTYTIEVDPFRALRRALSGRRRPPTPAMR